MSDQEARSAANTALPSNAENAGGESNSAAQRLREIADRTEHKADYEDDGYTAQELREEAVFLRETSDLIERLEANQRTGRIIHGDA